MILNVVLFTGEKLQYKIDKSTVVVGRSGQCDAVIPHEAVSRKHCQIDYQNGDLYVTDLGSINGVMVDGKKIPANEMVKFQSYLPLSFGAVQSLLVELEEEHTSTIVNPLLTTTLNVKEAKPKMKPLEEIGVSSPPKNEMPKKKLVPKQGEAEPTLPMNNFIALCVIVVIGFIFVLFHEEIMALLE